MPGYDPNAQDRDSVPGGEGGTSADVWKSIPPEIAPTPGGTSFVDIPNPVGAAQTGGTVGGKVLQEETPGDLGGSYVDLNKFLLMAESRRQSSTFNGMAGVNHRFRGHRESGKFNLMMQKLLTICCSIFVTLRPWNILLKTRETVDMYPTETEIQYIYHISSQIEYKEWLLLKDDSKKWFS